MTLQITVLGASGTYAGVDGACTGFLVRSDEATVMMDAGPGTLALIELPIPTVTPTLPA